jgi:hypothetical protein
MQNKFNLTLLVLIGCAVFLGCWSADSVDPNKLRSTGTSSPSSSPETSPSANKSPANDKNNGNDSKQVNNSPTNQTKSGGFQGNLPGGFQMPSDDVGNKMLREYGAMFVAKNGVTPPNKVVFRDESDVSSFQSGVQKVSENIGGITIELQTPAMNALKEALAEAKQKNLNIKPRNADSAKRSYGQTVENWASRVNPGLAHWVSKGRLQQSEANRIKSLSPVEQIPEIFKLESQGMFFAKDLSKSIIYSVAPPGTSQHISMLALDVEQFDNAAVRQVLANHGWFQTIPSDLPHFTYLGVSENELPNLGLKKVTQSGRTFWVPNI